MSNREFRGAWVIRKRGDRVERVGWYGYAPAAEHQADELNAMYETDVYGIEVTP